MKKVYISAGGTGGHINAALSVGQELEKKSYSVEYISGERYLDFQLFKGKTCHHIKSKPLRVKNPLRIIMNLFSNLLVFGELIGLYLKNKPSFVIGAGGYVCGPSLLAAKLIGKPIFIIEQNAVVGLTNKILASISNLIFTNFEKTKGLKQSPKIVKTGNPIRSSIIESKNELTESTIKILIFGGSLGATQINQTIEELFQIWEGQALEIIHQVGKGNMFETSIPSNVKYTQFEYLEDMNKYYSWSNIIISRAGASTISELRVVKRPTIIIPFPAATDNHQFFNALELKEENSSYIAILDHNKKSKELASLVKNELENIVQNNLFYQNVSESEFASEKIITEVEKYVRS